jgi:hypothetical protein
MAERTDIESTLASLLDVDRFRDYGPNGHGVIDLDNDSPA